MMISSETVFASSAICAGVGACGACLNAVARGSCSFKDFCDGFCVTAVIPGPDTGACPLEDWAATIELCAAVGSFAAMISLVFLLASVRG